MESPASLLQIYYIFCPKARSVKTTDSRYLQAIVYKASGAMKSYSNGGPQLLLGLEKRDVRRFLQGKFDFSYNKTGVVAEKLIHLKDMPT